MRSFVCISFIFALLFAVSLAQYQDGGYEGSNSNANAYSRSQYDSNESYAPRANNNYGRAPASYPKASRGETTNSKLKSEEEAAAEEEEKKPSQLELLLANSKFSCSNKKDGYYADSSVGCQVFHYCVGGAKHSWMCPEGTVFHQVHLNCVPAAQDICSQTEKYHIVNDYLHKPIEQNYGPNQTIRYHQRYYPDEFLGDPLAPPNNGASQQYPPPAPSSRPASSGYSRPSSYNSYDDENSSAYRAAPAYSPPVSRPAAPKPIPSSYNSYPSQPKPAAIPKKPTYSSYPASAGLSAAVRQRQPSYDSYDENSYKPSNSGSYSSAGAPSSYPASRPSSPPAYKPSAPAYQPYSAAAAASPPSYKPTLSSASYRPATSNKPAYSAYQGYQGAGSPAARNTQNAGYENTAKPYDYSGVTYEEDY